jgi:hypothetical protein
MAEAERLFDEGKGWINDDEAKLEEALRLLYPADGLPNVDWQTRQQLHALRLKIRQRLN